MRAGETALSLLSVPLNVHVLCALDEEERSLSALSQAVGLPPATTMRSYLRALSEIGAIERKQAESFPGTVRYALTASGGRLLAVGEVLQRWLLRAPNGSSALGSPAAKSAVKAMVDGWSARIMRALAARPCTLTELDSLIPGISYPALERRLTGMRLVGQVEPHRGGEQQGTPYRVSDWLRYAVAPMAAAIAWERRHAPEATQPLGRIDLEALFLLAIPLLELPPELSGRCRLAVETRSGSEIRYAGVTATFREGKSTNCIARLGEPVDGWVRGTALAWWRWVNGGDQELVEIGGDGELVAAVAEALRSALVPSHLV